MQLARVFIGGGVAGEEKVLDHVEKFLELQKSGKLNKYLEKRRRKLSSKDRKWLPSASPSSSSFD